MKSIVERLADAAETGKALCNKVHAIADDLMAYQARQAIQAEVEIRDAVQRLEHLIGIHDKDGG